MKKKTYQSPLAKVVRVRAQMICGSPTMLGNERMGEVDYDDGGFQ